MGEINWLSGKYNVHLSTDTQNDITTKNSFEILHKIVADIESLDIKIRKFVSEQLTSLVNEWNEDSITEITNEEFMKRLVLQDIDINSEDIIFYFGDGDMFCGHVIIVNMTSNLKCKDAIIAG